MNKIKALICGINGQDGSYLAKLLLNKNYEIYGTSRDVEISKFQNLKYLNIHKLVKVISMDLSDFKSVIDGINKTNPDEIYLLSAQSSVALSFDQPKLTFDSIISSALNMLEAIRLSKKKIKLFYPSSGECFGNISSGRASEQTAFNPKSPYAIAKSTAFSLMKIYRDSYNIFACNGILFNHESMLRPNRFVTKKIVLTAIDIFYEREDKLILGCVDIYRDWGWAPDFVEAIHMIMSHDLPDDFVIATGKSYALKDFVAECFNYLNLDWEKHTKIDNSLFRPNEIMRSCGNPEKAILKIGWKPKNSMKDVVKKMMEHELEKYNENKFEKKDSNNFS